jgi:hypothetical protein
MSGGGDKMQYQNFLKSKVVSSPVWGFEIDQSEINPILKPHQKAIAQWMVHGGRRACFAAFGLGKTIIQLEAVRLIQKYAGGKGLIILPLGVKQEFYHDAEMLGITVKFIRRIEEAEGPNGIYLTNYETIRDKKLDPIHFNVCSLDEAAILRGFGGVKTFRTFMSLLAGDDYHGGYSSEIKYRFIATATPSPNSYIELLAYSQYLGVMDVSQAKTRFFKRDSVHADRLTLHKHKEREFWLWVLSWGIFLQKPSDLGFSDEGYELPPLEIHWHEVKTDHKRAGFDKNGQGRLINNTAIGITESAREKRLSAQDRIDKLMELRALDPDAHRLIWHDLEAERTLLEKTIPGIKRVYGAQKEEDKEDAITGFSFGKYQELAAKPVMLGAGANFQRYCSWAVFLGIGFKFYDFIQAVHRIQRFLQKKTCRIDLIYTEAEREVRRTLERKWEQHKRMVENMTEIINEYGLSQESMIKSLTRALGVKRVEMSGDRYKLVNNDCVLETQNMEADSVSLVLTSIPFSTQYEYSPNYADFGHTNNNEHFFEQMDYLTPELLRVLKPGRIAAIHVKDRIVPGGLSGLGFQVVYPFHARAIEHYTKHGFAYMGMKTIVTDVVRENNQTYRLGWTEQCKDGTKMGVGMPEYLLLFRKPPTGTENSYADNPVVKDKKKYTRSRWQIDAHGFARSSGNRGITADDLDGIPHEGIFKLFREFSLTQVYDFEHHVKIGESLDVKGRLPVTFMLLQPQSWAPDVYTDITRMLTLNGAQSAHGREMHLCPMQFDLADRVITQFSMEGETVYDPFGGLGTVAYRSILLKRFGLSCELSKPYFIDSAHYCAAAERQMNMPTLFDITDMDNHKREVVNG